MELINLENEIKLLLDYRIKENLFDLSVVEAYHRLDGTVMCRIELFHTAAKIESRTTKYEGIVKEGFYYEAEQKLLNQLNVKEDILN